MDQASIMSTLQHRIHNAAAANVWLLLGLILVVLPHFAYQKLPIMVCCAILLTWRILHELKYVALPPRWLRVLLAFSAFAAVGALHHTIFGRNAGVALLLVMLCLKLLEMQQKRDFIVAVSLGYFVVITGFLYSQSMFVAVYLFVTIVVLTTSLITFNRIESSFLERFNPRLAGTMLLQAIPLALLLFVLFPRIPAPMWGLPEDAFSGKTGLSNQMSPGRISRLSDNDEVAFRVQFDSTIPSPAQLYWRGPVFSHFDGMTWNSNKTFEADAEVRNSSLRRQDIQGIGQATRYSVTLEPHNQHWLFTLEMPTQLPINSSFSKEFELQASKPVKKLIHYQAQSHLDYRLAAERLLSRHVYLQLPSNVGIQAQQLILQLITSISDQTGRDEKVVAAILNYFRQQPFVYTKQPPLLMKDPIDQFLFETRQGFCEHFASAFTFLMRAAGIPARVVTGYQGGELNTLGDYLIVRQSNAHAWAEVWISGKGWTRVDPTTVIPPERVQDNDHLQRFRSVANRGTVDMSFLKSAWQKLKFGWDNLNHFWNMWIIGYNSKNQESFLSWLGLGEFSWQSLIIILFSGLIAIVLAVASLLLHQTQLSNDPAIKSYRRFCRKMARLGLHKSNNEGAQHFAHRAILARPDLAEPINNITLLFNNIRYSEEHHPTAQLRAAVKTFKPRPAKTSVTVR